MLTDYSLTIRNSWLFLRIGHNSEELHFTMHYIKMKHSSKDFFRKCDQIWRKLRIWSYLLKKSLMTSFIFCAVIAASNLMLQHLHDLMLCVSKSKFPFSQTFYFDINQNSWRIFLEQLKCLGKLPNRQMYNKTIRKSRVS